MLRPPPIGPAARIIAEAPESLRLEFHDGDDPAVIALHGRLAGSLTPQDRELVGVIFEHAKESSSLLSEEEIREICRRQGFSPST